MIFKWRYLLTTTLRCNIFILFVHVRIFKPFIRFKNSEYTILLHVFITRVLFLFSFVSCHIGVWYKNDNSFKKHVYRDSVYQYCTKYMYMNYSYETRITWPIKIFAIYTACNWIFKNLYPSVKSYNNPNKNIPSTEYILSKMFFDWIWEILFYIGEYFW